MLLPLKSPEFSALTSVRTGFPHHLCHGLYNTGSWFSETSFISLFSLNQNKVLEQLTREPPVTGTMKGESVLSGKRNFPDVAHSLHTNDEP